MSGKLVRIPDDVKERLFDFVEGRTVKRKRGHGAMKPGEGVDYLLSKFEHDMYIRRCFVLIRWVSRYITVKLEPWDHHTGGWDDNIMYTAKAFYDFLLSCPKDDKEKEFYTRFLNMFKEYLDEYDNTFMKINL